MLDVRQVTLDMIDEAIALHASERHISRRSAEIVYRLEMRNAAGNIGKSDKAFAIHIGLTPDQYWKRLQAARVLVEFPEAVRMLEAGETRISHLSAIAGKITEANSDLLLSGIKHASKRDVESLAKRVTRNGDLLDIEVTFAVRLMLTKAQLEQLDRARAVLSHSGHVPKAEEIVSKALSDLLKKRDPVCKAERAMARLAKAEAAKTLAETPAPGQEDIAVKDEGRDLPAPGQENNVPKGYGAGERK
jgi:hypothetical protein